MSENESEQEELRREIERTRAELGETVEALSHKADVKAQAREKVDEAKSQAERSQGEKPTGSVAIEEPSCQPSGPSVGDQRHRKRQ